MDIHLPFFCCWIYRLDHLLIANAFLDMLILHGFVAFMEPHPLLWSAQNDLFHILVHISGSGDFVFLWIVGFNALTQPSLKPAASNAAAPFEAAGRYISLPTCGCW